MASLCHLTRPPHRLAFSHLLSPARLGSSVVTAGRDVCKSGPSFSAWDLKMNHLNPCP